MQSSKQPSQNNEESDSRRDITVLIVDDNAVHLGLFEDICSSLGYSTVTAFNSADALTIMKESTVSLVITDILLPDIDGIELARRIREMNKDIPIMAMTGGKLSEEQEEIVSRSPREESVITNFFTKGTSLATIQHTIIAHVENYRLVCSLKDKIQQLQGSEDEKKGLIATLQGFIDELAESEQKYKQLNEQLKAEAEFNNTLVQASPLYIVTVHDGKVMMMNKALLDASGYEEETVKGMDYLDTFIPGEEREKAEAVFRTMTRFKRPILDEGHFLSSEGDRILVEWHGRPIFDDEGNVSYIFQVGVDITQRRRLQMANLEQQKKLEYLAYHDELGVKNLDFFKMKLKDIRHQPHAILHIKVEGLTNINTHYTEETGNRLILKITDRLGELMKDFYQGSEFESNWVVARVHSVFMILLPGLKDNKQLAPLANSISQSLNQDFLVGFVEQEVPLQITTSIGGSLSSDSNTSEALRHHADVALEDAIKKGPLSIDRIGLYDFDMGVQKRLRETREAEIFTSLVNIGKRDEFFIKYQPQVDLGGKIVGMEALVRMQCAALNEEIVSPAEFIPFAEEKGLITTLDLWMLENACRKTLEWQKEGYDLVVSVNFSRKNLKQPGIVETVQNIIKRTKFNPDFLKLEITEGGLLDEGDRDVLLDLNRAGVHLAIDDLGTQQAAIGTVTLLKNDRFDILNAIKLDRTLIAALFNLLGEEISLNKKQAITLSNIIKWFGDLGLDIIVEGVEEIEQMGWLQEREKEFGYKLIVQGFYNENFPVTAELFEQKLKDNLTKQRILA